MYYKSKQLAKALIELDRDNLGQEEKIVKDLVRFCERKNITGQLPKIVEQLELENKRLLELEKCYIKTSRDMPQATINQIKKYINIPSQVETEIVEDKSIQGGFMAKYKRVVYNGSVRRQLERLGSELQT